MIAISFESSKKHGPSEEILFFKHYEVAIATTLRIEHAKAQIEAGLYKSITLEALSIESGFATQATFIKSFKNQVGCTPAEYIKTNTQ